MAKKKKTRNYVAGGAVVGGAAGGAKNFKKARKASADAQVADAEFRQHMVNTVYHAKEGNKESTQHALNNAGNKAMRAKELREASSAAMRRGRAGAAAGAVAGAAATGAGLSFYMRHRRNKIERVKKPTRSRTGK